MKKKKLLKKVKSLEALINVIQIADRQQTKNIAASDKFLQGQITSLWNYVQSENNSSHDDLKKQIASIWATISMLNKRYT